MANINELNGYMLEDTQARTDISAINDKIPNDASSSNKMATASDITDINNKIPSNASSSNKLATISDVSAAYKPKGNATLATLPSLTAEHLNWVYNMTEDFTTTSDFAEGAGKEVKAGNEVGIIDISTTSTPNYKYTVLGGFIDTSGFQNKTLDTPITVDEVQKTTVETALSAINTLAAGCKTAIGTLSSLTTTVKTNIVAAINELVTSISTINGKIPNGASSSNKMATASDVASRVDWESYAKTGVHNRFNYDAWKGLPITRGTAIFENNGVTLTATGADCYTSYSDSYPVSARIPVNEGDKIKLIWESTETTNLGNVLIMGNGGTSSIASANNTVGKVEYTVPNGITYVNVRFGVADSGNTIHYKNIMIVAPVDTDTTYASYAMTNKELTDFKIPLGGVLYSSNNLDDIKQVGLYGIDSAPTNSPEGASYCTMMVLPMRKTLNPNGDTAVVQVVFKDSIYVRRYTGTPLAWTAWKKYSGTSL